MSSSTEHREAMVEHLSSQITEELAKPAAPESQSLVVPEPGIYPGLPYEEYHRWDAANHSTLVRFNRSAAHAREEMLHPSEPSEALSQGTAAHCAVLEPERFAKTYVEAPKVDRRFREGKAAWAAFEERARGLSILSKDEMEMCQAIQKSVWAKSDTAAFLRARGQNEVSICWIDPITGVLCKARIDLLREFLDWPFVGDLKTADNASKRTFQRDGVLKYAYHQQAAFYTDGCLALGEKELRFAWLVVEKKRPFAPALYEIDEPSLEQGRKEYQEHLAAYAECRATGVWPGYPEGPDYVGLPSYALKGWGE